MGEVAAEIYPAIADWLLTSLQQGRTDRDNRKVYVEEGSTLADYEHG